jgi:hypothetical protein
MQGGDSEEQLILLFGENSVSGVILLEQPDGGCRWNNFLFCGKPELTSVLS